MTEGAGRLSAAATKAGMEALLSELPEATPEEAWLTSLVLKVDLSLQSGSKWSEVAGYMSHFLRDVVPVKPIAGGGGMGTTQSSNQWTNRIKQDGVANPNTTVFTIGQGELLPEAVRHLTKAIGQPTTRVKNAVIVYSNGSYARVVRLIVTAPPDGPIASRLKELAPAAPVDVFTPTDNASYKDADAPSGLAAVPNESESTDPEDPGSMGLTGQAWFVTRGSVPDKYANVEGGSHHYLRTTRATKDRLVDGDWLLMYRLTGSAPDGGMIYGVGRIHKIHKRNDDRYAILDHYLELDPPQSLSTIGGDPRLGAQISMTEIDLDLVATLLIDAGISSIDQLPVPVMRLGVEDVVAHSQTLRFPSGVIVQCLAALRSGKHLILRGPPGTGKSSLAVALGQAAETVGLSLGRPLVTTGSADWTSTETMGGYRLDPNAGPNTLIFQPGYILEAVATESWLIIDELNRADIDKAIGQFFSVLSGQPTVLPYLDGDGERIAVTPDPHSSGSETYRVSKTWRLIATMNERDRDLLFNLSEAFLRRFAIVEVPAPDQASDWDWILETRAAVADADLQARLRSLANLTAPRLGPAIIIDCANFMTQSIALAIEARVDLDTRRVTSDAINALVRPQLASLFGEQLRAAELALSNVIKGPGTLKDPPSRTALTQQNDPNEDPEDTESSGLAGAPLEQTGPSDNQGGESSTPPDPPLFE